MSDDIFCHCGNCKNEPEWQWEPHGDGWALYQGRAMCRHGLNKLSATNEDAFDWGGQELRDRIAELLNKYGLKDGEKEKGI